MEFDIRNFWLVEVFGVEFWITQTIVNTWIIMAVLVLGALIVRVKLRKMDDAPKGLQNVIEAIVEAFDGFLNSMGGEKVRMFGGWFFTVFLFILVSNLSGLVGMRPPTADWVTPAALAIATFLLIQGTGIYFRGLGGYLKGFFQPVWVFFPLNLIGELSRPVSLSFRLFGNILSGLMLLTIVYTLLPIALRFLLPIPLHIFFDIFFGALQTIIFCALSLTYIGLASEE